MSNIVIRIGGKPIVNQVVQPEVNTHKNANRNVMDLVKTIGEILIPITAFRITKDILKPTHVYAQTLSTAMTNVNDSSWIKIFNMVLNLADWLCVGVIIFAGVTWMFSNRTKAIEQLIGGCSGYLIIRHAKDIQEFLSNI